MAHSDKNIVITPNISSSTDDPKIVFSGADASTGAQNITLKAYPTSSGTLSFEGSAGQLFSISNSLSGTIFSVNDVSGIPSIEVLDTGTVRLAQYSGNVGIGTSTPTQKLSVSGGILRVDNTFGFGATFNNTASTGMYITLSDTGNSSAVGTNNGNLLFYTNTNTTERMRIDASGNLGLGVTPSAWAANHKALQITGTGAQVWADDVETAWFSTNTYASASATYTYLSSTFAAAYRLHRTSGQHRWYTAPSGTAGNAITFTQAMMLDASGNLVVGGTGAINTASGRGNITINGASSSILSLTTGGANKAYIFCDGTNLDINNQANGYLTFQTNATERLRIDASGNVTPGVTNTQTLGAVGDVWSNVHATTFTGALTGNASTATALATSRTLWGQAFTGAANVTGSLTSVGDITGTAAVTLTATAGTLALAATGANSITASTNGSSRLTINSAGNVTLTNDLTVSGTITNVKNKLNAITSNLGNPTVEEMALFHGQFNNKLRFISAFAQEESTDGSTWTTSTRATANQLADIMLGEGQTGGFNAIPAMALAGTGYYRLTWDQSQTGYVYLNALYIYCSTQGNNVVFTAEKFNNTTTSWETMATSTVNMWPGHVYIPHTLIPFSSTSTHYGKVRLTLAVTSASTVNPIQLNAIEWFGGYPAGKRNVESYDRLKNVTFPAVVNGTAVQASQLGVNNTTGTNGYGLSLYGGAIASKPTYGIMFQQTATFGSYGSVTADWATYFTMNSTANRGWIFKSSDLSDTTGNIASISTAGAAQFASTVTGTQLVSNIATGTAPLTVASTTLVTNLNADLLDGRHLDTLTANLRANRSLTGGGTLTVDGSYNVLWSARFIVISNGNGAHFSTSGYFDINCPTSGTITGVGGAANVTATAAGIPLTGAWQALYYILPIGSASTSLAANFRVAGYTSALIIPDEWILIAIRNSDTGQGVHFNNGYRLEPGESIDTGLYDAKNADLLDGLNSATANTASTIVARDASGNFSAGTITASLTGNASGSAATFTSTTQNSQFNSIGVGVAASTTAGTVTAPKFDIRRDTNTASGIRWYSNTYTAWQTYMSNAVASSGAGGNITAPAGTLVTNWALRNFVENAAGYGWTWESGTSTSTTPVVVAELRSSDGSMKLAGAISSPFHESVQTISTNYTITTGSNAMTPGPITIASGVTVTVPSGSVWTIV